MLRLRRHVRIVAASIAAVVAVLTASSQIVSAASGHQPASHSPASSELRTLALTDNDSNWT